MQVGFAQAARAFVAGTLLAVVGAGTIAAQTSDDASIDEWSRYVTPAEMKDLMLQDPDLQVIDIRSKKYVKKGVIPRSVWMPFKDWRGPKSRPGKPPSETELEAMLGANGIDLSEPIVVYNHSGKTIQTGRAAIVYWLLKTGGANDIAILNGGFKAWSGEELPQTDTHRVPEPITVDLTMRYDWWADPVEIFGVASGQSEGAILDARLDQQVKKSIKTGKPMMSMPMARYVPASLFMNPLNTKNMSEKGQEAFVSDLRTRGIEPGEGVLISVCQTGELSALGWFYASEILGIEDVRYYPDALQGWKSDGGLMFGMNPA